MLYALACVVIPCLIGLTMFALFELWDRRRRKAQRASLPIIDYTI
jgi:hypothetical protein